MDMNVDKGGLCLEFGGVVGARRLVLGRDRGEGLGRARAEPPSAPPVHVDEQFLPCRVNGRGLAEHALTMLTLTRSPLGVMNTLHVVHLSHAIMELLRVGIIAPSLQSIFFSLRRTPPCFVVPHNAYPIVCQAYLLLVA